MARCLAIDRDSLAIADDAALTSDVGQFEALARGDAQRCDEAAALYAGHLLADFDPDATPEFDDWLDNERARLKHLASEVFDRAIEAHCAPAARSATGSKASSEAATALARQWLALDPAAERAHRWLMRIHLAAGNVEAAQSQYEICRRAIAVADGRPPAAETRALLGSEDGGARGEATPPRRLREGVSPAVSAVASTSFVGRIDEVAEIVRLLNDPACRLLTLHGLGGVGKTRLAHSVIQQVAGQHPDGVTWVSLEAVERPAAVADAIARALGLELTPRTSAREALLQHAVTRRQLIVLDNFEHLLGRGAADAADDDPVDLLLALLRAAPDLRLLVTSRETLDVQEEWVYGIAGLDYAAKGAIEGNASLPAVDLFAQRARQAYLGFSLAAEMAYVLRICAQVEGLPLGIELAAAWIRTIPCAEIARELDRGLDVPAAVQRNRPERQQSLRAVIDFSWRLLARDQQEALAALSEFRGGFTRDAADVVAKASLRVISGLVDKALVRRDAEGRYSLHPLVRLFAAEQLGRSRSRRASVRDRHAGHYLRFLCSRRDALYGAQYARVTAELEEDLDNVRAAWATKVSGTDAKAVCEAARPLCVIFDRLGLYEEWVRTFAEALVAFERTDAESTESARRRLVTSIAYGHWRRGDVARASTHRAQLETWIESTRDAATVADLHKLCGLVARDTGDIDGALRHFLVGAEAARQAGDPVVEAQFANEIGVVHWRRGELELARQAFSDAQAINESSANIFDLPTSLHNVGYCDLELGRFEEADEAFERALRMVRERANLRGEALIMSSLGILARRRGDLGRAETLSRACLAIAERMGNASAVADATDDLAQVLERRGELAEALALYERALEMSRALGQTHLQCMVLLHVARLQSAAGNAAPSAHALREALKLAEDHAFHTARLIGLLQAAGLRFNHDGVDGEATARRWCDSVLGTAGANADVRDAVPPALRALADGPVGATSATSDAELASTSIEIAAFLDERASASEARIPSATSVAT